MLVFLVFEKNYLVKNGFVDSVYEGMFYVLS